MKRSIQTITLVSSLFVAMSPIYAEETVSAPVQSEKSAEQVSASSIHTGFYPEATVLSRGMFRGKVVTRSNVGSVKSYDDKGKKVDVKDESHSQNLSIFSLEYGVNDKLTLGVAAPFVLNRESEVPSLTPGEKVKTKYATGLSDIRVGAFYNFVNTGDFLFSSGLGMYLPTGAYADVKEEKDATGYGSYTLGLRMTADYQVVNGLWLSAQDQEEFQVASVKNKPNDIREVQKGLSRKSFVQAAYGFGALSQDLKVLSAKTRYAYEYDAKKVKHSGDAQFDGKTTEAATSHKAGFGLGLDGTGYNIPVALEGMYYMPVGGKNTTTAVSPVVEMTLSAYVQI
jgi:hypothetical protein